MMTIMKNVDYAIHVSRIEDVQCELIAVTTVLKICVTLNLDVFHASVVTMINVINGKILTLVWLEEP